MEVGTGTEVDTDAKEREWDRTGAGEGEEVRRGGNTAKKNARLTFGLVKISRNGPSEKSDKGNEVRRKNNHGQQTRGGEGELVYRDSKIF